MLSEHLRNYYCNDYSDASLSEAVADFVFTCCKLDGLSSGLGFFTVSVAGFSGLKSAAFSFCKLDCLPIGLGFFTVSVADFSGLESTAFSFCSGSGITFSDDDWVFVICSEGLVFAEIAAFASVGL